MKRILSLFLACLMVLSLCACSSSLATEETVEEKTATATSDVKKEDKKIVYPEGFSAGFGRTDITPELFPVDLGGGAMATSVADPLYASCTALCDGENVALIYHLDMKQCNMEFFEMVTKRLTKKFNVPAENVILNTTHSHNSPVSVMGTEGNVLRYLQKVLKALDEAAELALLDLAPAEIYTAKGHTPKFAFVRRYLMGDGSWNGIQMNNPNKDYREHESEADDELRTIRFDRGDKKDILLVNWQAHAAHGRGVHPNLITSDFIYELRSGVEKDLDVHFSYHNGSSGNLNFTSYLPGEQKFSDFHAVGYALVDVVKETVKTEEKVSSGEIKSATTVVTCEVFVDSDKLIEGAQKYANANEEQKAEILADYGLISSYHASAVNSRQRRITNTGPTADIKLFAISCGDIAFFTSPFEQFDSDGKYIRDNSPFKMTFSCAYSNGHNGYLPSSAAYPHGCYEVYTTPFVYGTSDKLNAGSIGLLNELYQ